MSNFCDKYKYKLITTLAILFVLGSTHANESNSENNTNNLVQAGLNSTNNPLNNKLVPIENKFSSIVFGDAQFLNNFQIYENTSNFIRQTNNYLIENENLNYYAQSKYLHTSWKLENQLVGKQIVNSTELGVYKQLHGLNYGALIYNNLGKFHEDYNLDRNQRTLAFANQNLVGGLISLGATGSHIYYSLSFMGDYQSFSFSRYNSKNELISSTLRIFNLGIYSQIGKIAWEYKNNKIELLFGASMMNHYLKKFNELYPNQLIYKHWNGLNVFNVYSNLGISYLLNYSIKQYVNNLSFSFNIQHSLSEQNYNLTSYTNSEQEPTVFNKSLIYQVKIKNNTTISKDMSVFGNVTLNWFKGLFKYNVGVGFIYSY